MVTCSAYGCQNTTKKSKNKAQVITFHLFPRNPERRALWTKAVRRKNWTPSASARLCSIHFKEEDIDRTSLQVVRVREHAIPTIFPAFPSYLKNRKVVSRASKKKKGSPRETVSSQGSQDESIVASTSAAVTPMKVDTPRKVKLKKGLSMETNVEADDPLIASRTIFEPDIELTVEPVALRLGQAQSFSTEVKQESEEYSSSEEENSIELEDALSHVKCVAWKQEEIEESSSDNEIDMKCEKTKKYFHPTLLKWGM